MFAICIFIKQKFSYIWHTCWHSQRVQFCRENSLQVERRGFGTHQWAYEFRRLLHGMRGGRERNLEAGAAREPSATAEAAVRGA